MGQMSGVVVVLPVAECSFEEACAALIPVLQPGLVKPTWEVKSRSQDGRRILVDPESTDFFSMATWTSKPNRLAWLTLQLDTTALFRGESLVHTIVETYLWTALTELAAAFGYLTNYDHQLADDWIESKVLEPLSLQHYGELVNSCYDLLLLSKPVREGIPSDPKWTILKEGPEGALIRR